MPIAPHIPMIDPPRIRCAAMDDLPTLHALIERAYRGDTARRGWTHEADLLDGQRTDIPALAAMIADPAQHILLAVDATAPVGCVLLAEKPPAGAYLGLLTVDPDRQAGGLGSRLIAVAEETAVAEGASWVEMTVIRQRRELIAYYERRGYLRTGEQRPFPLDDPRFGLPRTRDLAFVVLRKLLPRPRSPD